MIEDDVTADFSASADSDEIDLEEGGAVQVAAHQRRTMKEDEAQTYKMRVLFFSWVLMIPVVLTLALLARNGLMSSEKGQDDV